jgi:hypothetical protein
VSRIYSTSFIQVAGLLGQEHYVVPAGFVAVVREIDVYASTGLLEASFSAQGPSNQVFYFTSFGVGAQGSQLWRGRVVINPTFILRATADTSPIDVTICGYLLTLP